MAFPESDDARPAPDAHPAPMTFVLAGGCFWCLDAVYRITRGVTSVVSGYTGGAPERPSYYEVCSGSTGHAEAVAVTFDPAVVPEDVILDLFFTGHDPTTLNRQGYDVGTQYRSSMFYADEEQRALFERSVARTRPLWHRPVVTTLEPLGKFWEAEPEHQDFYGNQPWNGYCRVIINPKLATVRKRYSAWLTAR